MNMKINNLIQSIARKETLAGPAAACVFALSFAAGFSSPQGSFGEVNSTDLASQQSVRTSDHRSNRPANPNRPPPPRRTQRSQPAPQVPAGPPTTHRLQYLVHSGPSLAHILKTIDSAKSSIEVTYYLFEAHQSAAKLLIDRLVKAAERNRDNPNFKIRVLLDALEQSSERQQILTGYLGRWGIEIKFFNDSISFSVNNRTHIKYIVVDDEKLITGGRNIADYHFSIMGDPADRHWTTWYDKDVLVTGPVAKHARELFDVKWNSNMASSVRLTMPDASIQRWVDSPQGFRLRDREQRILTALQREESKDLRQFPVVGCNEVYFITDDLWFNSSIPLDSQELAFEGGGDSNEQYRAKRATKTVIDFLNSAKETVFLENYAFQPVHRLLTAFENLKRRGVRVHVATNKTQDSRTMTNLTRHYSRRLHGDNFQVRWLTGYVPDEEYWWRPKTEVDTKVHSKIFSADGKHALITSFNIDARSYNRNYESVLVVKNCPVFAEQVERDIMRTFNMGEPPSGRDDVNFLFLVDKLINEHEY